MRRAALALAAILAIASAQADPAPPTIAEIVVTEGLAMRAERNAHPDRPGPDFAEAHRTRILSDVRAALTARDPGTVARVTTETRYAGWQVTGFWLAHGETVAEIAQVKGRDAPARVAEAIDLMLKEPR